MKKIIAAAICLTLGGASVFAASYANNKYQKLAQEYTRKAERALDYGDYELSEQYAAEAEKNAALSDEYIRRMTAKGQYEEDIKKASAHLDMIKSMGGDEEFPDNYEKALAAIEKSKELSAAEDYPEASKEANRVYSLFSDDIIQKIVAKGNAKQAIDGAQGRIEEVKEIRGDFNFPIAFKSATEYLDQALVAYSSQDYDKAFALAQSVVEVLAEVHPVTPLPQFYIVRPWAETKDCFWNIAGRPYVYNNPFLWENLYEANKSNIPQRNNPNLIRPGMKMEIPSISGEYRDGVYSPEEEYNAFSLNR